MTLVVSVRRCSLSQPFGFYDLKLRGNSGVSDAVELYLAKEKSDVLIRGYRMIQETYKPDVHKKGGLNKLPMCRKMGTSLELIELVSQ